MYPQEGESCLSSLLRLSVLALSLRPSLLEKIWAPTALCHIKTKRSKVMRSGGPKNRQKEKRNERSQNKGTDVRTGYKEQREEEDQ